jgi:putative transposase
MRRVPPSMLVREDLDALLHGGAEPGTNIVSELVDTVTRLVLQQLLEADQADYLGGRARYERRAEDQRGSRNGYEPGRLRTAEGAIDVRVPQVRGAGESYRSNLMTFLEGNSDVLERLVTEMYARGLSTRDVEDAFRDATGELLISKSAVSGITDQLWEDYQAFCARVLSDVAVEYFFCDASVVIGVSRREGQDTGSTVDLVRHRSELSSPMPGLVFMTVDSLPLRCSVSAKSSPIHFNTSISW